MRAKIALSALMLVAVGGLIRADEHPVDRSELDKRVVHAAYESALLGTEIFNKGHHEGCFRLYQGTLIALVPMLDHRKKLQDTIKLRLDRAAKLKDPADAAFELRVGLDEIQEAIAPSKDKKESKLWDRLGGEKAVRAVVQDIVLAAAEDKRVNFFRDGKVKLDAKGVEHLQEMLVEMISEYTGGPLKYSGKSMKEAHAGMMITHAEFDALKEIITATLKKYKVADSDVTELGRIVESTRKDIVEPKK